MIKTFIKEVFFLFFSIPFLAVLGLEVRVSHLLGKSSTT
jgi:hypothetical protein